jgi:protein SCO1
MPRARRTIAFALPLIAAVACTRGIPTREYSLTGQVLAVRSSDREIVIKHEDIEGFMPAMTMPYRVRDGKLLDGLEPGDLVTATLVVQSADAWLSAITATGRRMPVPEGKAMPRVMDPLLQPGDPVPAAHFVDQDGRPFSPADFAGRPWAVTFVYTRCPLATVCPTLERRFVSVQQAIRRDRALADARLATISIDPEFDRPAVLKARAAALSADTARWRFLTGDRLAVDRFSERFGVTVVRGSGDPEELVHSMRTAVVDRHGRLVQVFEGTTWEVEALVAVLRQAARS